MEKTSRRNFGKLIAGAAAALPLTSVNALHQSTKESQRREGIESHQNTPPDLILEQGSLKIDVKDLTLAAQPELPPATGGGYQWLFPRSGQSDIYMNGIQIISGSGQLLFYIDRDHVANDEKPHPLTVLVHMEGDASNRQELILSTNRRFVTFKVPSRRRLKKNHQNDVPIPDPGSPGRVRFRYLDPDGNAGNFDVKSIAVASGSHGQHKVITRVDIAHLQDAGPGTQVWVWFRAL